MNKELKQLETEMEAYLKFLVKKGCSTCGKNGGYTDFPITGKVCPHMIKARERKFGRRVDALVLRLANGIQSP